MTVKQKNYLYGVIGILGVIIIGFLFFYDKRNPAKSISILFGYPFILVTIIYFIVKKGTRLSIKEDENEVDENDADLPYD